MYPLGNFNPGAPADPKIVAKAAAFYRSLPDVPGGLLKRLYYHWTVAPLGMCFGDYNGEARYADGAWELTVTHNPQDNAPGLNGDAEASHTWLRNTGALGAAITGMDGPDVGQHDFGADPVTVTGLTHLCALGAAFCLKYGIDVAGTSSDTPWAGEPNILTHGEAALRPGNPILNGSYNYGLETGGGTGERWDLTSFVPTPDDVAITPAMATQCGDALRSLTRTYKIALDAALHPA